MIARGARSRRNELLQRVVSIAVDLRVTDATAHRRRADLSGCAGYFSCITRPATPT
jgi:hypothetical protein